MRLIRGLIIVRDSLLKIANIQGGDMYVTAFF